MNESNSDYPATLSIDYPDGERDKLTTFFRLFLAIPIIVILFLLTGVYSEAHEEGRQTYQSIIMAGGLFLPTVLMILFRQKYPRWWFDWNVAFLKFSTRINAYLLLLRDEYPSTDEDQAVHIEIPYPDVKQDLNRWLPLVKWFLAIPHLIALAFLGIGALVCAIIAWFSILFTGRYPRPLFDFVVGFLRWSLRVCVYAFYMTTDRYPPFRLGE